MVKLPEPVFYLDRFLGEIRQISPSQPLDKYPAGFFDHPGLYFYMLPWAQQAAYYHETYDRILDLPTSNPYLTKLIKTLDELAASGAPNPPARPPFQLPGTPPASQRITFLDKDHPHPCTAPPPHGMPVVVELNCPYAWTILCAGIYTDEQWQLWKPNVGVYRDQLLNWDPYYQAQHQRSMFAFGLDAKHWWYSLELEHAWKVEQADAPAPA